MFLAAVEEALHTPDGGVTDVNFERPGDTGSQPLVDDAGASSSTDDGPASRHRRRDRRGACIRRRPRRCVRDGAHEAPARGDADATSGRAHATTLGVERRSPVEPPVVAAGASRGRSGGGVGIGLPYTGPERRADLRAHAGAAARAGAEEAALAAVRGDPRRRARRSASRSRCSPRRAGATRQARRRSEARSGDARRQGERGARARRSGDGAIKILDDAEGARSSATPMAQLVLGHAHAALHQSAASLAAYTQGAARSRPTLETERDAAREPARDGRRQGRRGRDERVRSLGRAHRRSRGARTRC